MREKGIPFGEIKITRPEGKGASIDTTRHINERLDFNKEEYEEKEFGYIRAKRKSNTTVHVEYFPDHSRVEKMLSVDEKGNNTTKHDTIKQKYYPLTPKTSSAVKTSASHKEPFIPPEQVITPPITYNVYQPGFLEGKPNSELQDILNGTFQDYSQLASSKIYSTLLDTAEEMKAIPKPEEVSKADGRLKERVNVPKTAFKDELWELANKDWKEDETTVSNWEESLEGSLGVFPIWIALTENEAVVTVPLLKGENYKGAEAVKKALETTQSELVDQGFKFELDETNELAQLIYQGQLSASDEAKSYKIIKEHIDCYLKEAEPSYIITRYFSPQDGIEKIVEKEEIASQEDLNTNDYLKAYLVTECGGNSKKMIDAWGIPRSVSTKISKGENLSDASYKAIAPHVGMTAKELIDGKKSTEIIPIQYEGTFDDNYKNLTPAEMIEKDLNRLFNGNLRKMFRATNMPYDGLRSLRAGKNVLPETLKKFNQMYQKQ